VRLSDKYVNLIHAEDVGEICVTALQRGRPGAAYNVSDGVPRTWREIGRRLCGDQFAQESAGEQLSGKRISTAKLRLMLQEAGTSIRHPDLFRSLECLP
jgi:nucleoside-diphosphate-sugar epimerase